MCFDRSLPAAFVVEVAEALEAAGVDQLWVIEDCFYTAGISLAATALARTERLTVGLGILPAVARNPAITAMELATLADLAPGRLLAGIGHGVQGWMHQMGARPASPLTALDEVITVVRRLLHGESVTFDGRYVTMRNVVLDSPPDRVPPVLAGVRGPKSLSLAGRVADGVVLAEGAGPTYVRQAVDAAGSPTPSGVGLHGARNPRRRATARRIMAPFVGGMLDDGGPACSHTRTSTRSWSATWSVASRGSPTCRPPGGSSSARSGRSMTPYVTPRRSSMRRRGCGVLPGPTVELAREDLRHVTRLAAALR